MKTVESASIKDATTTFVGVNHIGLSVKNLDKTLAFYQKATNFELIVRKTIRNNPVADNLFATANVEFEVAILKSHQMLLELTEFKHNANAEISDMPPQGPGMTHTCFQSSMSNSGYDKFVDADAKVLTRGNKPVDMGGYGVTYAYAYDPEGNMFEMEQLDPELMQKSGYAKNWGDGLKDVSMWMSQVALVTHDIEQLMAFYQELMGYAPYRYAEISDRTVLDDIVNIDGVHLKGGWFKLDGDSKMLEIWEYLSPVTEQFKQKPNATDLGYTFSFEVGDLQAEYQRLKAMNVEFFSEPVEFAGYLQVYARDISGNVFALRQVL